MKTLSLLRHAKSSWGDASLDDHERPLNRRGQQAAERVGREIERRGLVPERVLCSSAVRARQTLERIEPHLPTGVEISIERGLYLASPREMLENLAELDDAIGHAMLIAHNPGIALLAHELVGEGDAEALAGLTRKYPTGALAVLSFQTQHWEALQAGSGRLELYLRPKALPAG